ncbi:hypothetical protein GQ55_2G204700 [Panicum hallii var. hallii]|uniref:WAT1-related protein n=1 Tax=Panicum hallii var. hallii TaxID=1504633 RepID=A0A2T7EQR8_9POAL|nr:hypothetical protein GQ55_2G204700 [Panicum hallii var. hallii]
MDAASKKAYVIAIVLQVIYTGFSVLSKAALDNGMSIFVFNFYRQATGSLILLPLALLFQRKNVTSMPLMLLLKLFLCALFGNTLSLNVYNVSLKLTSATLVAAAGNAVPAVTLCMALLLRMEVVNLRSSSGIAKVSGAALCLAGVLVMAFYAGPGLSPVSRHRAFAVHAPGSGAHSSTSKEAWIVGTFLMVINNMAWSLSAVWQARILKEFPNRMLVAVSLCVFSALQSLVVAAVAERDFSRWKQRLDVSLVAIAYNGFVVTGVSYYLQAWCVEMKGPVFCAAWLPLYSVFTMFCSSFFLGEIVHLGSILGAILLIGGLYSVLWGKSKESEFASCSDMNRIDGAQDEQEHNKPDADEDAKSEAAGGQV